MWSWHFSWLLFSPRGPGPPANCWKSDSTILAHFRNTYRICNNFHFPTLILVTLETFFFWGNLSMLLITLAPRPPSSLPPQTARTRWRRPRSRPYNNIRNGKLWGKNAFLIGKSKKSPSKYLTFRPCPSGTTRTPGPRGSSPEQGRRPMPGCVWKSKKYILFLLFYAGKAVLTSPGVCAAARVRQQPHPGLAEVDVSFFPKKE